MAEYIEREAALNRLCQENCDHDYVKDKCQNCYVSAFIEYAPAADVVPVVHGRWEPVMEGVWNLPTPICVGWSCSLCGRYEQYKEPYCNCGARMEDGE